MVSCNFFNKSGEPSQLYDKLKKLYGSNIAAKVWDVSTSQAFLDSYPNIPLDANGEVELAELVKLGLSDVVRPKSNTSKITIANVFGVLSSLSSKVKVSEVTNKIEPIQAAVTKPNNSGLIGTIDEIGIDVTIDLDYINEIESNSRTGLIALSILPENLRAAGINLAEKTPLNDLLSKVYDSISPKDFNNELLMLALSNEDFRDTPEWDVFYNKVVDYIAETFNITPTESKDFLNTYLTNTDLSELVKVLRGVRKTRMLDQRFAKGILKPLVELTAKLKTSIEKKIKIYFSNLTEAQKTNSTSYVHLENLRKLFEQYKTSHNVNAILGFIAEMSNQIGLVETRINKLELSLLNESSVTDESLYRLYQYVGVFDNLEDVQVLMSDDTEFAKELQDLFAGDENLRKFKTVKSYMADLLARNLSVKAKVNKISTMFLSQKLIEKGKGRISAKYESQYQLEYDNAHRKELKEADKKDATKRAYNENRKKFVASRLKSNRKRILQEEAERVSSLLQSSPNDISFFERMFLDRNALNDDLIQIVSEMIDRADYAVDTATTEVYKELYATTIDYEKNVRDTLNQANKYDELLVPKIAYNEETGEFVITKGKEAYLTTEYYPQVFSIQKDLWSRYYEALRTGSENDPNELRILAEAFSRNNFDSPFTNEYYKVLDYLKQYPEAEQIFLSYRQERAALLRPFKENGKVDILSLPPEVSKLLADLEAKYNQVFSIYDTDGIRKDGMELEIAIAVSNFKGLFKDMYTRQFKQSEFNAAREAAKQSGKEQEFLDLNTTDVISKVFYKDYYKQINKDVIVKNLNKDYRAKTKLFKDYQTNPNWDSSESDRLLTDVKDSFEAFLNAVNNTTIQSLKDFFRNNVVFEPNKNFRASAKTTVADVIGSNSNNPIPLPVFSILKTNNKQYHKVKPKAKWYDSFLKPEYIKAGKNEFDEVVPTDKWKNPNWSKVQNDPNLKKAYDSYYNIIAESDKFLLEYDRLISGSTRTRVVKLPTVAKQSIYEIVGEQGLFNYVKTKFGRFKRNEATEPGYGSDTTGVTADSSSLAIKQINREVSILTDEKGEPYKRVPVNYRFSAKEGEASLDIPTILALNYQMAKNYSEKSKILFTAELVKVAMAERDVVKTAPSALEGVKSYIDALTGKSIPRPVVSKGKNSNSYKALESFIDDKIYGLSTSSSFKMSQFANAISKYTADVLLVGNYYSAGTNLMTGNIYNFIEAAASRHFDAKDLRKAQVKYYSDTLHIVNDIGKRVSTSKTNLLNEKFTILTDWRAVGSHFLESTRALQFFKGSRLHFMSNMAEHGLQSTAAYAMLNNIKVLDKDKNYLDKEGNATKDVDKAMTLDEAYTVEGNKLIRNPKVVYTSKTGDLTFQNESEEIEFYVSRLIKDVNADLQGQYNPNMKAEVQRAWWGQLIMLLRKFAPRGVHRRFRSFGSARVPYDALIEDDKFYSRAQGVYNEGYYTTSIRLLAELYRDAKILKWELLSFQGIGKLNKLRNLKVNKLEDWQRSNLKKTTRDLMTATTLYILGMTAASLKEDEDDEVVKALLVTISFYSIRGFKELTTFINPNEMLSTLRTPSIALTMVNRLIILLTQLGADGYSLATGGDFERYQTGRRRDETKIYKNIEDLAVLLKNMDRDMEEALSWFLNRRSY